MAGRFTQFGGVFVPSDEFEEGLAADAAEIDMYDVPELGHADAGYRRLRALAGHMAMRASMRDGPKRSSARGCNRIDWSVALAKSNL